MRFFPLALTMGCLGSPPIWDPGDSGFESCQPGMTDYDLTQVFITEVTVDGRTYVGLPTLACVGADGLSFDMRMSLSPDEVGRVLVAVSSSGAFSPTDPEVLQLEVAVGDVYVFYADDMLSGGLTVQGAAGSAEGSLAVEARDGAHTGTFRIGWSGVF